MTQGQGIRTRKEKGRRFVFRPKVCPFCANKDSIIDYKDPLKLRRFITDRARIEPRRRSGACGKHQRAVALAIKRARYLALLPYTPAHMRKVSGTGPPDNQQS